MSLRAARQPNNWFERIAGRIFGEPRRKSMIGIIFPRRSTS
jgi:hypothetical protein